MALPGVTTVINDRFYVVMRRNIPVGPRVTIIGRRTTAHGTGDVQDLDPYNASTENSIISTFGAGSDLHRGFLEAAAGGAQRITLIALPSDTVFNHSTGTISSTTYTNRNGVDLFNDAFDAAAAARSDIIVPWGRGAGPTEFQNPATPGDDAELGFYANNVGSSSSWIKKIADKCAEITVNIHPCFAVLGVKPWMGASDSLGGMTPADITSHVNFSNMYDRNVANASGWKNGFYVSVVAAEIKPLGYNDNYDFGFSNGAAMYAGYISTLDSWSSPTSKTVYNVASGGLRYTLTRTQQQTVIDSGIVPVALDYSRIPKWIDAKTYAHDTSDYTRLTTLRIVYDTILMVRQVTQGFVGEPATLHNRNSIETAITGGLRAMQQVGAIFQSDFTVSYIASENKAVVDLVIQPAFELRNIEVSVAVQL